MPGQFRSGLIAWTRVGSGERWGQLDTKLTCIATADVFAFTIIHNNARLQWQEVGFELHDNTGDDVATVWWPAMTVCMSEKWQTVCKHHLPNGAYTFAFRRAYRLGYLSQRETPVIAQSLGASNSGIAWADTVESATAFQSLNGCVRTHERESVRIDAAEKINNAYLLELVRRLQAKRLWRCVV
jgi:hypothetical protein